MTFLRFELEAVSKLRARTVRTNQEHFRFFTPKKTKQFENTLIQLAKTQYQQSPYTGPIAVSIAFEFPKPKTVKRKYPSVKPDIDNLSKAVLDALNEIVWEDDALIVNLEISKRYESRPLITVIVKHVF